MKLEKFGSGSRLRKSREVSRIIVEPKISQPEMMVRLWKKLRWLECSQESHLFLLHYCFILFFFIFFFVIAVYRSGSFSFDETVQCVINRDVMKLIIVAPSVFWLQSSNTTPPIIVMSPFRFFLLPHSLDPLQLLSFSYLLWFIPFLWFHLPDRNSGRFYGYHCLKGFPSRSSISYFNWCFFLSGFRFFIIL